MGSNNNPGDRPANTLTRDQMYALVHTHFSAFMSDVVVDSSPAAGGAGKVYRLDDVLVGISWEENQWNANAHYVGPLDDSFGLWSINMRGALGPDRRKRSGIARNEDLWDPATNARAAADIYEELEGGPRALRQAWSTSYDKTIAKLKAGQPAGADLDSIPGNTTEGELYPGQNRVEGAVGGVVGAVTGWADGLGVLLSWITNADNWRRIGIGALGVLLLAMALMIANKGLFAAAAGGAVAGPAGAAVASSAVGA